MDGGMKPSLDLFLVALICGLGGGLGWALMTWLVAKLTGLIDRG